MPSTIYPRKADDRTYEHWRANPRMLVADENHTDDTGNPVPVKTVVDPSRIGGLHSSNPNVLTEEFERFTAQRDARLAEK